MTRRVPHVLSTPPGIVGSDQTDKIAEKSLIALDTISVRPCRRVTREGRREAIMEGKFMPLPQPVLVTLGAAGWIFGR
jgi:hypothetical protein